MTDPVAIVAPATVVDVEAERQAIIEARDREARASSIAEDARVVIGLALLRVRPRWPERGPTAKGWGEFLGSVGLEQRTAWNYMEFARRSVVAETVSETQPDPPSTYAEAGMDNRPRAGDEVPRETVSDDREETGHSKRHDPAMTPQTNPDSDEWYTPLRYLEAARQVMGEIDLDPATCEAAQDRVRAASYFTKEDDGLDQTWIGRVWMNPPYSQPLARDFIYKLIDEWKAGSVTEAIVLQNASTDTAWFHELAAVASRVCFTKGRISFEHADGAPVPGNRFGQVFFYLGEGHRGELFEDVFGEFGLVGQFR